jgi:hypothetical protein
MPTLDENDAAARLQPVAEEALVSLPEPSQLDAEIGHALRHQPVLIGIVHLVQLQVRIGLEQARAVLAPELERLARLVDIHPQLAHGDQEGLRQPRRAERRRKVRERAVGRADQDRGVATFGEQPDHPAGDLLVPDTPEPTGRDRLEQAAELVDLTPGRDRQRVGGDGQRPQHGRHPQIGEAFAAQVVSQPAQHGGGGIEVGKVGQSPRHRRPELRFRAGRAGSVRAGPALAESRAERHLSGPVR